jgi:hypothetical protein
MHIFVDLGCVTKTRIRVMYNARSEPSMLCLDLPDVTVVPFTLYRVLGANMILTHWFKHDYTFRMQESYLAPHFMSRSAHWSDTKSNWYLPHDKCIESAGPEPMSKCDRTESRLPGTHWSKCREELFNIEKQIQPMHNIIVYLFIFCFCSSSPLHVSASNYAII